MSLVAKYVRDNALLLRITPNAMYSTDAFSMCVRVCVCGGNIDYDCLGNGSGSLQIPRVSEK